jgi:hypothetical protein
MTKKAKQNAEVYDELTKSGKSLLELYLELKKKWMKVSDDKK